MIKARCIESRGSARMWFKVGDTYDCRKIGSYLYIEGATGGDFVFGGLENGDKVEFTNNEYAKFVFIIPGVVKK